LVNELRRYATREYRVVVCMQLRRRRSPVDDVTLRRDDIRPLRT